MIIPAVLLVVGLVLTLCFILFRAWEVRRGSRLYNERRLLLDHWAERVYETLVLGGVPLSWRRYAVAVSHEVSHEAVRLLVAIIRAVEKPLVRLSYRLRVSAPKTGAQPVSEFLRTIAPDKQAATSQKTPSTI
jgi:hypothetical protein